MIYVEGDRKKEVNGIKYEYETYKILYLIM